MITHNRILINRNGSDHSKLVGGLSINNGTNELCVCVCVCV